MGFIRLLCRNLKEMEEGFFFGGGERGVGNHLPERTREFFLFSTIQGKKD